MSARFARITRARGKRDPEAAQLERRVPAAHRQGTAGINAKHRTSHLEPTREANRGVGRSFGTRRLRCCVRESGAEDARTPNASRPPGVPEPREASGVRPIYRRFLRRAGVPRLMVRMNLPG